MSEKHSQMAELLLDLEFSLRQLGLWSAERPGEEAMASQEPFCLDTLDFEEWLQFIFIERMSVVVEQGLPLPDRCGLAPMAEEYFRGSRHCPTRLIEKLEQIDRTLST